MSWKETKAYLAATPLGCSQVTRAAFKVLTFNFGSLVPLTSTESVAKWNALLLINLQPMNSNKCAKTLRSLLAYSCQETAGLPSMAQRSMAFQQTEFFINVLRQLSMKKLTSSSNNAYVYLEKLSKLEQSDILC